MNPLMQSPKDKVGPSQGCTLVRTLISAIIDNYHIEKEMHQKETTK